MASQSKCSSAKTVIQRPDINWRDSLEAPSLILSVVKEVATSAPIAALKKPACLALLLFKAIQPETVKGHKEKKMAYERLAYNSSELIIAIWRSYKKAMDPEEWLSAEMRDILVDLSHTLENICSFVNEQLSKSRLIRVIFRRADEAKINEFHEHLKFLMQKFELQSHMNINDVLTRVPTKNDQTSQNVQEESGLEKPKQVETNRQTQDEHWLTYELKKIQKEAKDRKSELERLRVTVRQLEEAEEEIAQLKRALAATSKENNRLSEKRREDKVDEEEDEDWEGNSVVDSEEEEWPVRRSYKVKRNASGSLKRRLVAVDDFTDDEDDDLHSTCVRSAEARRKLSSISLRVQETEDDYMDTDEEDDYIPLRKSPKVKRKSQTSSGARPRYADDLMARCQDFTLMGLGSNARSGLPIFMQGMHSNPYFPTYGASFSPPMGPYRYGVGMPGLIVNAGVGNINISTISNVGNVKVYRPRSQ